MYNSPSTSTHSCSQYRGGCVDPRSDLHPIEDSPIQLHPIYSHESECCSKLVLPSVILEPPTAKDPMDYQSEARDYLSPIVGIKNLINRITLMGHTAMTFCMAGVSGFFYQITQSHCIECWSTRLLPCAIVAGISGLLCRAFDKRRAELIEQAKEIQSFVSVPTSSVEYGVQHDKE